MSALTISRARSVWGLGLATHPCSQPAKMVSSHMPLAARYLASNFSGTAGKTLSSIGHLAPLRAPVLHEAQGRIPELEEILCADPDTDLHLGLGGHDVEAIRSNPGDDLLGHLGG